MTKEVKKEYESPQLEIMKVRIEKGFGGSFATGIMAGDEITEGDTYGNEIFS